MSLGGIVSRYSSSSINLFAEVSRCFLPVEHHVRDVISKVVKGTFSEYVDRKVENTMFHSQEYHQGMPGSSFVFTSEKIYFVVLGRKCGEGSYTVSSSSNYAELLQPISERHLSDVIEKHKLDCITVPTTSYLHPSPFLKKEGDNFLIVKNNAVGDYMSFEKTVSMFGTLDEKKQKLITEQLCKLASEVGLLDFKSIRLSGDLSGITIIKPNLTVDNFHYDRGNNAAIALMGFSQQVESSVVKEVVERAFSKV